jgi:hypothetical protein
MTKLRFFFSFQVCIQLNAIISAFSREKERQAFEGKSE